MIVHALCWSPEVLAWQPLAERAWTRADEMRVLADLLLDRDFICPGVHAYDHHDSIDGALYEIECKVREWILDTFHPGHELRVTGGWPNIAYVVYKNDMEKGTTTLSERVEILPGVCRQPRLLRVNGDECMHNHPKTHFRCSRRGVHSEHATTGPGGGQLITWTTKESEPCRASK